MLNDFTCHAERLSLVMLNEVKHLYEKDLSLTLKMTLIIQIPMIPYQVPPQMPLPWRDLSEHHPTF